MPAILAALLPILGKFLERLIPDPEARAKAQQEFLGLLMAADLSQMEVNRAEALTGGWFRAGWRPAVGWVCALALAYQYLIVPLTLWASHVYGLFIPEPPRLDDVLWELLFGMLGMGALRTFEKVRAN